MLGYAGTDQWTLRRSAAVIACSQASAARMLETQKLDSKRLFVVPNGVDLPVPVPGARKQVRIEPGISAIENLITVESPPLAPAP